MNSVQLGLLLFLLASGLTLIFGIMDFINLSHGSFYMMGAYFCGSVVARTGSFLAGVITGLVGVFVLGALIEWLIARKLYKEDHLDHVLVTFGLILVMDTLVHLIWGPSGLSIPLPDMLNGQIVIGTIVFPTYRTLIIVGGLAVAAILYLLVARTRLGMLIRAGASNRDMVESLGINIDRLFLIVFAIGAAMAGFAGILIAPITEATIGMGNDIIIIAFVVVIVGGIGSIDFLKLLMEPQFAETAAPAISAMLVYILMAAVLAFKPSGLFPPAGSR
ncbi:MAG: branched-chain amino acid ABC transporter permease [Gammaproteobacteria bacterium]|nr:branched-chain amino acid ABC transporter permease [Gammaproteobacteria bacterium]